MMGVIGRSTLEDMWTIHQTIAGKKTAIGWGVVDLSLRAMGYIGFSCWYQCGILQHPYHLSPA